jgi:hypothetical protein
MSRQTPEATKHYRDTLDKEKVREYQRWYNQLPESKKHRSEYRQNNPVKQLLVNARSRAKKRGIIFELVEADIIIPEVCPILGIPLFVTGYRPTGNSPTLDQIIPGTGYVKDNVCVISHKANTMKQNNTIEDLERFLRYMRKELI